jgi:predicted heme/steroid binding protein
VLEVDGQGNISGGAQARAKITLLDVARVVLGIVLLSTVLSYYVTGTPVWGKRTRLTNPRYIAFTARRALGSGYLEFSEEELAKYNGKDRALPIYVAISGNVYDVTSNPSTYGPSGAYSFFSGRDAARAFITGCFRSDLTHDLRGLDEVEAEKSIKGWQNFFENHHKYWYVGTVRHAPLTGDPPAPCNGNQIPPGIHRQKGKH